jgi:hypothetical protein
VEPFWSLRGTNKRFLEVCACHVPKFKKPQETSWKVVQKFLELVLELKQTSINTVSSVFLDYWIIKLPELHHCVFHSSVVISLNPINKPFYWNAKKGLM